MPVRWEIRRVEPSLTKAPAWFCTEHSLATEILIEQLRPLTKTSISTVRPYSPHLLSCLRRTSRLGRINSVPRTRVNQRSSFVTHSETATAIQLPTNTVPPPATTRPSTFGARAISQLIRRAITTPSLLSGSRTGKASLSELVGRDSVEPGRALRCKTAFVPWLDRVLPHRMPSVVP